MKLRAAKLRRRFNGLPLGPTDGRGRQTVMAAGGLAYLFRLNGRMAAAACGGLLLMSGVSFVNGAFSRWLSKRTQDEVARSNSVAEQALSLVRLVRSHAAEDREAARFARF